MDRGQFGWKKPSDKGKICEWETCQDYGLKTVYMYSYRSGVRVDKTMKQIQSSFPAELAKVNLETSDHLNLLILGEFA